MSDILKVLKNNFTLLYNVVHYYNEYVYTRRCGSLSDDLLSSEWDYGNFLVRNVGSLILKITEDEIDSGTVYNSISEKSISFSTNKIKTCTSVMFNEQFARTFKSNSHGIDLSLDKLGHEYEDALFQESTEYGVMDVYEVEEIYHLLLQLPLKKNQKFRILSPNNWTPDVIEFLITINKILKV